MLDSIFQRRILAALNLDAKYPTNSAGPGRVSYRHIFAGIDPAEKAKRRKTGRAQRRARAMHRRAAA